MGNKQTAFNKDKSYDKKYTWLVYASAGDITNRSGEIKVSAKKKAKGSDVALGGAMIDMGILHEILWPRPSGVDANGLSFTHELRDHVLFT